LFLIRSVSPKSLHHETQKKSKSSLYFAIGLTIVLFFTWQSIEWKTYEKSAIDYQTLNVDEDVIEEILIVLPIVVPPPPPPPPVIINVVNDIVDTPEDPIPTSEV
jgi:protein TonB